ADLGVDIATTGSLIAKKNPEIHRELELLKKFNFIAQMASTYHKTLTESESLRLRQDGVDLDRDEQELLDLFQQDLDNYSQDIENKVKDMLSYVLRWQIPQTNGVVIEIKPTKANSEYTVPILAQMYLRYAEKMGWKVNIVSESTSNLSSERGGAKLDVANYMVIEILGAQVYSQLMYETGDDRFKIRMGEVKGSSIKKGNSEKKGFLRAEVLVNPLYETYKFQLNDNDIEIETFKSSGAGGQHVNKTESGVRLTHRPSGISVRVTNDRSQHRNKALAYKLLESKLINHYYNRAQLDKDQQRQQTMAQSDSRKYVRDYDYVSNFVSDARTKARGHISQVEAGELELFIDAQKNARLEEVLLTLISALEGQIRSVSNSACTKSGEVRPEAYARCFFTEDNDRKDEL
ncbi:MAG: PCRF domain-containing protein, partial [Bdellovibrionales bacterium]|nr:PCRF domain-containing protein [Bdellovibrionales bacterium]